MKSQEWDGEGLSTQHQLAIIRKVNEDMSPYTLKEWSGDPDDITGGGACLFSGDVEALFPSLDQEVCAQAARRTVARSWDRIRGVNIQHALIGLASANTQAIRTDMRELEILHIMPVRKFSRGTRPGEFTEELTRMAEVRKQSEVRDLEEAWTLPNNSKWRLPHSSHTRDQERKIIQVYIAHLTRTVISCHMYKVVGEVRL